MKKIFFTILSTIILMTLSVFSFILGKETGEGIQVAIPVPTLSEQEERIQEMAYYYSLEDNDIEDVPALDEYANGNYTFTWDDILLPNGCLLERSSLWFSEISYMNPGFWEGESEWFFDNKELLSRYPPDLLVDAIVEDGNSLSMEMIRFDKLNLDERLCRICDVDFETDACSKCALGLMGINHRRYALIPSFHLLPQTQTTLGITDSHGNIVPLPAKSSVLLLEYRQDEDGQLEVKVYVIKESLLYYDEENLCYGLKQDNNPLLGWLDTDLITSFPLFRERIASGCERFRNLRRAIFSYWQIDNRVSLPNAPWGEALFWKDKCEPLILEIYDHGYNDYEQ